MPDGVPHARLTHLLEQVEATTREFLLETAPLVSAYHASLMREGMKPSDALAMALDAQRQLLSRFMSAELDENAL